jgi:hypothetical protein
MDGEVDITFHRADPTDPRLEQIDSLEMNLMSVLAPGFLSVEPTAEITPNMMRSFTQCVIHDTARRLSSDSNFLLDGARQCFAPNHIMKRELILQGPAWAPAHLAHQGRPASRKTDIYRWQPLAEPKGPARCSPQA